MKFQLALFFFFTFALRRLPSWGLTRCGCGCGGDRRTLPPPEGGKDRWPESVVGGWGGYLYSCSPRPREGERGRGGEMSCDVRGVLSAPGWFRVR